MVRVFSLGPAVWRWCVAGWVAVLAGGGGAVAAEAGPRPNLVVLLADDLRWDALGCSGNPVARTPHLDRLASRGLRFDEAFVTTSICSVSRASVLTGQYARRHGVNDFATPLRDLTGTYPARLRAAGYWTGFIGKWGVAAANRDYLRTCATAFDFWAGDEGQTSFWHERTCNYLTNSGMSDRMNFFCTCPPAARKAEGVGGPGRPHPSLKDPVHAETEFMPAKVRSFLDQRDPARPFCLSVSFKAPHGPWNGYAPRYGTNFATASIPRRGNVSPEAAAREPAFLQASLESARGRRLANDAGPDGERDQLMRTYYRLVEGLDFAVGEVMRELETRGLASNTVVIVTSDNGHFSGEHGFFGKWLMHEESIRVPFLLLDPRRAAADGGRVCHALVLNVDVAPTLLDFAGVPAPAQMQGRSVVPLLDDPARAWRESFFYEHLYAHHPKPPMHIERSEGVRTRDWKYIVYPDQSGPDREALYELARDPLELENLAGNAAQSARLERFRREHRALTESLK